MMQIQYRSPLGKKIEGKIAATKNHGNLRGPPPQATNPPEAKIAGLLLEGLIDSDHHDAFFQSNPLQIRLGSKTPT